MPTIQTVIEAVKAGERDATMKAALAAPRGTVSPRDASFCRA